MKDQNMSGSGLTAIEKLCKYGGVPIDRVARRVVAPGIRWETAWSTEILTFDSPVEPPESQVIYGPGQQRPRSLVNMRINRLVVQYYWRHSDRSTVVYRTDTRSKVDARKQISINHRFNAIRTGYSMERRSGSKEHQWLCRCDCGLYCVRTGRQIQVHMRMEKERTIDEQPQSFFEFGMCSHCFNLEVLRGSIDALKGLRDLPKFRKSLLDAALIEKARSNRWGP